MTDESTTTVTATAIATVTATKKVTVTATKRVTATVTERSVEKLPPAGPVDVTAEYVAHASAVRMSGEQRYEVVQATLESGVLSVLTTMRDPWGGWACDWEPVTLAGESVKFIRILYQDYTVFRICQ